MEDRTGAGAASDCISGKLAAVTGSPGPGKPRGAMSPSSVALRSTLRILGGQIPALDQKRGRAKRRSAFFFMDYLSSERRAWRRAVPEAPQASVPGPA